MPYGDIPARTLSPTRSHTNASPPGNVKRPVVRPTMICRRQNATPPAAAAKTVSRQAGRLSSGSSRANTAGGALPKSGQVPVEVVRQPLPQFEIALAGSSITPGSRQFRNLPTAYRGFDRQLQCEFEARCALDLNRVQKSPPVQLEVVRRIV